VGGAALLQRCPCDAGGCGRCAALGIMLDMLVQRRWRLSPRCPTPGGSLRRTLRVGEATFHPARSHRRLAWLPRLIQGSQEFPRRKPRWVLAAAPSDCVANALPSTNCIPACNRPPLLDHRESSPTFTIGSGSSSQREPPARSAPRKRRDVGHRAPSPPLGQWSHSPPFSPPPFIAPRPRPARGLSCSAATRSRGLDLRPTGRRGCESVRGAMEIAPVPLPSSNAAATAAAVSS
jgi:hypothetical protein